MKCPYCAASVPPGAATCEYCGSTIRDEPKPSQVASTVFDQIRASEAYRWRNSPERLARLPKLPSGRATSLRCPGMLLSGCGAILLMLFFAVMSLFCFMVPLLLMLIGLYGFFRTIRRNQRPSDAPIMTIPAIVRDKKAAFVLTVGRKASRPVYEITFAFERGVPRSYMVEEAFFEAVSVGDAGVLFTQSNWALDFDHVCRDEYHRG